MTSPLNTSLPLSCRYHPAMLKHMERPDQVRTLGTPLILRPLFIVNFTHTLTRVLSGHHRYNQPKPGPCSQTGGTHPERPARLASLRAHLERVGVLQRCAKCRSRPATNAEVLLVHTQEHLETVRQKRKSGRAVLAVAALGLPIHTRPLATGRT